MFFLCSSVQKPPFLPLKRFLLLLSNSAADMIWNLRLVTRRCMFPETAGTGCMQTVNFSVWGRHFPAETGHGRRLCPSVTATVIIFNAGKLPYCWKLRFSLPLLFCVIFLPDREVSILTENWLLPTDRKNIFSQMKAGSAAYKKSG